jgi:FRG domain
MPAKKYIESVLDLISTVEPLGRDLMLFRGQDRDDPLLPKIARKDPTVNTAKQEREMIEELKRRAAQDPILVGKDDWDCLVYAQHYGMATRLLDWTTNPLIALWFAAIDQKVDRNGYVYLLFVDNEIILDKTKDSDPFSIGKTKVFKPNINNPRIAAQSGWFTVHRYSKQAGKFVDLHKNRSLKTRVLMKGVPGRYKAEILQSLEKLGVNNESVFPGIEGSCRYVNWQFGVPF